MWRYIVKRLLLGVVTIYGVATLVFFLMRIVPGDPALIALSDAGRDAAVPARMVEAMRVRLGFATIHVTPKRDVLEPKYGRDYPKLAAAIAAMDGQQILGSVNSRAPIMADGMMVMPDEVQVEIRKIPLLTQYLTWMWNSTRLDFGNSLKVNRPVIDEWMRFFPVTASIVILAAIMTAIVALPLGILSAIRQDKFVDYVARIISIAGLSLPSFWVALLIILGLVIWFRWLPPLEYVPVWQAPWQSFQQMFFPAFSVAFAQIGIIARMTRSSMLEVLREDYVRTAWSKGLNERTVVFRHALKNAFLPVLTVFGLQFGFSIGGLVVVERAFNLPGLGNFLVDSVVFRDYNAIQATLFATAIFVTLANLLVDVAYGWFNPRIRYT